MVYSLYSLRHDTVVGGNNQDYDICKMGTAGTHLGECLVARSIQEYNAASVDLDLVCTDVLGDAAELGGSHVGRPDCIQKLGLTMVYMAHYCNNRRTFHNVGIVALLAFYNGLVVQGYNVHLAAVFIGQDRSCVGIDLLVYGDHLSHSDKLGYYVRCLEVQFLGQFCNSNHIHDVDALRNRICLLHILLLYLIVLLYLFNVLLAGLLIIGLLLGLEEFLASGAACHLRWHFGTFAPRSETTTLALWTRSEALSFGPRLKSARLSLPFAAGFESAGLPFPAAALTMPFGPFTLGLESARLPFPASAGLSLPAALTFGTLSAGLEAAGLSLPAAALAFPAALALPFGFLSLRLEAALAFPFSFGRSSRLFWFWGCRNICLRNCGFLGRRSSRSCFRFWCRSLRGRSICLCRNRRLLRNNLFLFYYNLFLFLFSLGSRFCRFFHHNLAFRLLDQSCPGFFFFIQFFRHIFLKPLYLSSLSSPSSSSSTGSSSSSSSKLSSTPQFGQWSISSVIGLPHSGHS